MKKMWWIFIPFGLLLLWVMGKQKGKAPLPTATTGSATIPDAFSNLWNSLRAPVNVTAGQDNTVGIINAGTNAFKSLAGLFSAGGGNSALNTSPALSPGIPYVPDAGVTSFDLPTSTFPDYNSNPTDWYNWDTWSGPASL